MQPNSGPDPVLTEMFRRVRQDARSDPKPAELARTFPIDIGFDGAGQLPIIGQAQILPLGLLKARVLGAVIVANGVGSATIDLRHGTLADVPSLAQMYGASAANIPTLNGAASAILDITGWTINLWPQDVLLATLLTVSGTLTTITLSLYCRHLKWPAGATDLTAGGNTLSTTSGDTVTLRS